jgi:CRP-like cAMP-binding protein
MSHDEVQFKILVGAGTPVRSFKQGETIFREGDSATELFVVESGQVEISSGGRVLATIGENGIFGEMVLIDKQPRSATASAATDVTLVPVTEKQFLYMVSETPHFALNVMRALAGRLRAKNAAP